MIRGFSCLSVSIHAPVWGATVLICQLTAQTKFQSTHPCGVRQVKCNHVFAIQCFNPRTRVGCDQVRVWRCPSVGVSIHAPVWGATRVGCDESQVICFNPRTRVGCDNATANQASERWFQSTHPCGVRRADNTKRSATQCFNPRTRVGCDSRST